jgi:beta-lactamase superfamily II metal-dependent hydrolase
MKRLMTAKAKTYGTYRSGNIKIKFRGSKVTISAPSKERLTAENYKAS